MQYIYVYIDIYIYVCVSPHVCPLMDVFLMISRSSKFLNPGDDKGDASDEFQLSITEDEITSATSGDEDSPMGTRRRMEDLGDWLGSA